MAKKSNPFLEKKEEKDGKDLDGDGEKGEKPAHQMKVLGKKAGKGGKMCANCKKAGKKSCSHL